MQKNKRPLPGLQLYLNNISFQNFTRKGPGPFSQLCVSMVAKCRWMNLLSLDFFNIQLFLINSSSHNFATEVLSAFPLFFQMVKRVLDPFPNSVSLWWPNADEGASSPWQRAKSLMADHIHSLRLAHRVQREITRCSWELQLGTSSRAIHGGAYFSAVSGQNFILTTVLRLFRLELWNRQV